MAELPVANAEPLAAELDAFLHVVRNGGRPIVDVEDGLWAVAIATSLLGRRRQRPPDRPVRLFREADRRMTITDPTIQRRSQPARRLDRAANPGLPPR